MIKWVYLATQSILPYAKIRQLIAALKSTNDEYIIENIIIFESYLTAIQGLFTEGVKEIRDPSMFDEWSILPRHKLNTVILMIDKFYKNENIEEEARLLQ